jgi:membrane protease subunit HflK
MQSVLGSTSKVLIDQKAGNNLLYLPLDKLVQQASTPGAAAPPPAVDPSASPPRAATPDATVTVDPSRSRDALRNRER